MTILKANGDPIIEMGFEDGFLTFSAKMRRKSGKMCARVNENEWWALVDNVWDLTYKPDELKIWHQKYDIGLQIGYDSTEDIVSLRGSFYQSGVHVDITPSKIKVGNSTLENIVMEDVPTGLSVSTH